MTLPQHIYITVQEYCRGPEEKYWVGSAEFSYEDTEIVSRTRDCSSAAEAYGRALSECRKHLNPGRK